MNWFKKMRVLSGTEAARLIQIGLGILFVLAAPLVGLIPGPGGTIVFAIGLGLLLRNSLWAKRRYVRFKRQSPKIGGWADWGLRRQSAKRRSKNAKLNGSDSD